MKWLNSVRMRLVLVGIVAAIVFGGVRAKADFTFGEPTKVPNVNSSYRDCDPCISADGLELYFNSQRAGGSGGFDLWVAKRASIDEDWEQPVNLGPTVNAPTHDHDPSISAAKLTLYFCGYNRSGGRGGGDLWMTTRPTVDDDWGEPVNLESSVNSTNDEMDPYPSADDQELYFCSLNRSGGHGNYDIWLSTKKATERNPEGYWDIPVNLGPNVNTSYSDHSPCISADGLALFFCSDRPGGYGSRDLWITTRPTVDDDWGEPVNLGPNVNSSAWEDDPAISFDGRWLFFNFDNGSENIWQVSIDPVVDFNVDGIVDSADMCIMIDHWGEDYTLCDIGPMPWGDGIVDVQDLIVLAEHLFERLPGRPINP